MTVELLQTLSLVSCILAGLFFVVAIALFFLLDVRKLIGDISGANARKAIENIRQQNESSGDKAYKPSPVNMARGKLTDKISQSGRLQPRLSGMGGSPGTQKFATTDLIPPVEETSLLSGGGNETTVLTSELTNETTILSVEVEPTSETTLLSQNDMQDIGQAIESQGGFSIDVEMGFMGSSEIIE